jgi:LytR cell envelope-related transcriptional attenuator
VTVPGRGDLAPRRRARRRGRWGLRLLLLLVVASVAVGGWYGWQALRGDDKAGSRAALRPCIEPTHPPAPAVARDVHIRVLNGTHRAGLARDVAIRLRARGFRVSGVGNNSRVLAATTVVRPEGALAAAEAVAEQLPAVQIQTGQVRVVTLIIGRDFRRLASVQAAAKTRAADVKRAQPSPSRCPSASG